MPLPGTSATQCTGIYFFKVENGSQRTENQRIAGGCIIAGTIGLNLWYDYYHPRGLILDAIILIVLLVRWIRKT